MRKNLEIKNNQRLTFRGTVGRFGRGHGNKTGSKMMLLDVHQKASSRYADHLWVNYEGKTWQQLGEIFEGDILELDGRIKPYVKGGIKSRSYSNVQTDYELSYITNIKVIKKVRLPKGWVRNENLEWMDSKQFDHWSKFHMHRQFDINEGKIGEDKKRELMYQKKKFLKRTKGDV